MYVERSRSLMVVLCLSVMAPSPLAAQEYQIVDLGTLAVQWPGGLTMASNQLPPPLPAESAGPH